MEATLRGFTAYILVTVESGSVLETRDIIRALDGIRDVVTVTGTYDLIAVADLETAAQITGLVLRGIQKIRAVTSTTTLLQMPD